MNDIWDEYYRIELIGSGAFSKVYRAKSKLNNEYVAIKEIKRINISQNSILNEIKSMKELKSENSVSLIDSIETNDSYYFVLELCLISVDEYIKKRGSPLSTEEIKEILINLNESFKEMKNKNIIHRDLKPSNILLSISKSKIDKMCFKISDFGLSKLFEENEMSLISSTGTSLTMAPEVLKGENDLIGYKSDIWSLGIIIRFNIIFNLIYFLRNYINFR
jgi:serine/threonine-protein kinase ULK/ATG1